MDLVTTIVFVCAQIFCLFVIWSLLRENVRLKRQRRTLYRRGLAKGTARGIRREQLRREAMLKTAGRRAEVRPGTTPSRSTTARITSRELPN